MYIRDRHSKALYLREMVRKAIQDACAAIQRDREAFISHLMAKQSGQLKKELAAKRKELEQAKARQAELDNLIAATFEKLATGILTDGQFQQLNGRYLAEQEALKGIFPASEASLPCSSRTSWTTWGTSSSLLTGI